MVARGSPRPLPPAMFWRQMEPSSAPRLAPLPDGSHALDAPRAAWPFKLDGLLPEILGPYLHSATVEALGSFVADKFQGMPMLYVGYDIYTDGSGGSD